MNPPFHRSLLTAALAGSLLVLASQPASAQTCFGAASFRDGSFRVGGVAGYSDDATGLGVMVAAGADAGPWGSLSATRLNFDAGATGEEIAPSYGATLGYGFDVGGAANPASVQVCPYAGYQYLGGPNIDLGGGLGTTKVRSRAYLGGASIGAVVPSSPGLYLVPSAGVSYVAERAKVFAPGFWWEKVHDDYGVFDASLGLVFNRRITTQFGAAFPFGVDDAASNFSLAVGINFGR